MLYVKQKEKEKKDDEEGGTQRHTPIAQSSTDKVKIAKVPSLKLLERLYKRNEYFCSSHHPLRETIMNQTGQTKEQRTKFLQKCYNSAKKKLIHNWDVEPKGTSTF